MIEIPGSSQLDAIACAASRHMQDLGTLDGPYTEPFAINDLGQIVGRSDTADSVQAFRWTL